MTPEQLARSDAAAKAAMADMVFAEVRKLTGLRQKDTGDAGDASPDASSTESYEGLHVEGLSNLVQALGGQLELVLHLPGGVLSIKPFKDAS